MVSKGHIHRNLQHLAGLQRLLDRLHHCWRAQQQLSTGGFFSQTFFLEIVVAHVPRTGAVRMVVM